MASRVIAPATVKLELSGGDWILIKKRLNHGEQTDMFARIYVAGIDGQMRANPLNVGLVQATAYLLDWNLLGLDEKPLLIRDQPIAVVESILRSFGPEQFAEIRDAIQKHIALMDEEHAAAKNLQDGATESPAISPSPSITAGGTSGLVN
jgi:hypothetical protein